MDGTEIAAAAGLLLAGYQLGHADVFQRGFDAAADWADRQNGPRARLITEPVYLSLLAIGFAAHPIEFTRNLRAAKADKQQRPAAPRLNENWATPPELVILPYPEGATGCHTTTHCANWDFCHRCDPARCERVTTAWRAAGGAPDLYKQYATSAELAAGPSAAAQAG